MPRPSLEPPILPPNQEKIQRSRQDPSDGNDQANGIPGTIQRRIRRQKGKRRHDAAGIAKANRPRRADAAVRMALQVHDDPANDQRATRKGAHSDEVDAAVLGSERVADGNEDCEADER